MYVCPKSRTDNTWSTFAQSLKTYSAACLLTSHGYGPDALKLGRSLFENMVVAYWMVHCADPEWVVERMREHREYSSLVWVETIEEHRGWEQPDYEQERRDRLDQDRERLTTLCGRHAEESWWANEANETGGGGGEITIAGAASGRSWRT